MPKRKKSSDGLEPFCTHMNGHPPRCQARKRNGQQCQNPATSGMKVCRVHGAGDRTRVKKGLRKDPVTANVKHKLYSGVQYDNVYTLLDKLEETIGEDGKTARELAAAKMVLEHSLTVFAKYSDAPEMMKPLLEALNDEMARCLEAKELVEAQRVRSDIKALERIIQFYEDGLNRILTAATRIIGLEKTRAETKAKLAEVKALQQFALYVGKARALFHEIASQEQLDLLEERLRRELLNPLRLDIPPKEFLERLN